MTSYYDPDWQPADYTLDPGTSLEENRAGFLAHIQTTMEEAGAPADAIEWQTNFWSGAFGMSDRLEDGEISAGQALNETMDSFGLDTGWSDSQADSYVTENWNDYNY